MIENFEIKVLLFLKMKEKLFKGIFFVLKVFEGLNIILVKMKILESLLVLLFCDNITVYYGLDRLIDDTNLGCLN